MPHILSRRNPCWQSKFRQARGPHSDSSRRDRPVAVVSDARPTSRQTARETFLHSDQRTEHVSRRATNTGLLPQFQWQDQLGAQSSHAAETKFLPWSRLALSLLR